MVNHSGGSVILGISRRNATTGQSLVVSMRCISGVAVESICGKRAYSQFHADTVDFSCIGKSVLSLVIIISIP